MSTDPRDGLDAGTPVPTLPDGVAGLLADHLAVQRWYAGTGRPADADISVVDARVLASRGEHHLHWAVLEVEGARYQLLLGERPGGEPADFLAGRDDAFLGCPGATYFYDATYDAELMLALFEVITGSRAVRVRPVGAEQSNTSLVFDDRTIVKVYRRLLEGANPDIEVTTALVAAGFTHVAEPAGTWQADGIDLAFAQRFLAGGSEGWALALTSLRDLFHSASPEPAEAGGDFSGEAGRLGRVSAEMHLALARAFPEGTDELRHAWPGFVDQLDSRLHQAVSRDEGGERVAVVRDLLGRLRSLRDPGPALRVHGDYHLGQVMRTDGGWFVLDFEGEPARPFHERTRPSSAMKDVTGMLRSLDYAARFVLRERESTDPDDGVARADAWEAHNRAAFLDGYLSVGGIDGLLAAPGETRELVLAAFELDKALYELRYEQAYRPTWVDIPTQAIGRILSRIG
jgi:maltokinase